MKTSSIKRSCIVIFIAIVFLIYILVKGKTYILIKNAFIFNSNDIILNILLQDEVDKNNYDYLLTEEDITNISNQLCESNRINIKEENYNYTNSKKGIDMYLDGKKEGTKDYSLIFKKRITLLKQNGNKLHLRLEINNIKNNNMENIVTNFYSLESEDLSNYIESLYRE